MEEEEATQRPKRQVVHSQKGKDYDEFLETEKEGGGGEEDDPNPKKRKVHREPDTGDNVDASRDDGVGGDPLPSFSPARNRHRGPKGSPEVPKSSWLGLVNSIMDKSSAQMKILMDSVDMMENWMRLQQESQQGFMERMLMRTTSPTSTIGYSEDPLDDQAHDPITNQPTSTLTADMMFQQGASGQRGHQGHQQAGGSVTGTANP